jgi:hypothetical protein
MNWGLSDELVPGIYPVWDVMDHAASKSVGTAKHPAIRRQPIGVPDEIRIALAPARWANSMSEPLSPTTTEFRGLKLNSAAASSIKARLGFLQPQFASGV